MRLAQAVRCASGSDWCTHRSKYLALGLDAQVDGVVAIDRAGQTSVSRHHLDGSPRSCTMRNGWQADLHRSCISNHWSESRPVPCRAQDPLACRSTNRVFSKPPHFLLPGSYVAFALTGELGVDYSNASSTLLMDVRTRAWSSKCVKYSEIPMDLLPPIYPATQVLGNSASEAANDLDCHIHTKVILGSGDEHAACLGAGVTQPGLVCDIAGTAEPVCASSQSGLI